MNQPGSQVTTSGDGRRSPNLPPRYHRKVGQTFRVEGYRWGWMLNRIEWCGSWLHGWEGAVGTHRIQLYECLHEWFTFYGKCTQTYQSYGSYGLGNGCFFFLKRKIRRFIREIRNYRYMLLYFLILKKQESLAWIGVKLLSGWGVIELSMD